METIKKSIEIGGKTITVEMGKMAKQASGSCLVTVGDTAVLVSVVTSKEPKENVDFLPLTVDYRERTYSAGKIPGGFFKREGRPRENEILTSRLIDRSVRPLFPETWHNDTQLTAIVVSFDGEHNTDIPGIIGASIALITSQIPFLTPISSVRIGRVEGN
ncbi:MAG: polyribonucleotide nucleotidyltransferase, partial [Endomicrobiales bacterium]